MTTYDRYARATTGQGLYIPPCDFIDFTQTSATVETLEHYQGGSGGTLVCTLVLTYVDASRETFVSIEATYP
jgi:hypothetical protein